jgi:tripartite-type tricarboxylate transporter receptor subunit TctC
MMHGRGIVSAMATLALLVACVQLVAAQGDNYPSRPIRIIAPFAAGTSVDVTARRLGDAMAPLLGQPIVVENKGGAAGTIGADVVAKSPPDG